MILVISGPSQAQIAYHNMYWPQMSSIGQALYRIQKMPLTSAAASKHFTDLRVMTFVSHTDVSGRCRLHSAAELPGVVNRALVGRPAPENLLVRIPEVLGQESVDDGVDG